MRDPFKSQFFQDLNDDFDLYRENQHIDTVKGFFCGKDYPNSIQTTSPTKIRIGDKLIHTLTSEEYTVYSLQPLSMSNQLQGYILSYKPDKDTGAHNTYHIGTISGNASVGTNATFNLINASPSDILSLIDKELPFSEEKTQLLKTLIELENGETDIEPGVLSKFSSLLEKHENLFLQVGIFISKLLFGVQE